MIVVQIVNYFIDVDDMEMKVNKIIEYMWKKVF